MKKPADPPVPALRDCVQCMPGLKGQQQLVLYDSAGQGQLRLDLSDDEDEQYWADALRRAWLARPRPLRVVL